MKRLIQFRITKGEQLYIAECIDLPVVTQAKSLDKLVINIIEALLLHLEDEDFVELDLDENYTTLVNFELGEIHA